MPVFELAKLIESYFRLTQLETQLKIYLRHICAWCKYIANGNI